MGRFSDVFYPGGGAVVLNVMGWVSRGVVPSQKALLN